MIIVTIPSFFVSEISYSVDVLMNDILKIEYRIEVKNQNFYKFTLPNGKKFICKDHFFSFVNKGETYLRENNIPRKVKFVKNRFILGDNIPVLFGSGEITESKDNKDIICDIDIMATIFFMLSRWEEYVNNVRDPHDRFPATESLAYKCDFLERPIINEYAEMIWKIFIYLGYKPKRIIEKFYFNLTHDVDSLLKWLDLKSVIRNIAGDILKRKQYNSTFTKLIE